MEAGSKAARLAALNALAVVRHYLGSLDKVTRIIRRLVYGVASLPLGTPVELEVIFGVSG